MYVASPSGLPSLLKLCPWGQKWAGPRDHIGLYKIYFLEYGHVAYQIKENEAYNYMLANVLPLHTSLTPGRSKGHFFLNVVMVHVELNMNVELNVNEAENTNDNASKYSTLLYTHSPQMGSKGQNNFFLK